MDILDISDVGEKSSDLAGGAPSPEPAAQKLPWYKRLKAKREKNTTQHSVLNRWIMLLFPVFIMAMAEINQAKKVTKFLGFCADHPRVILFDILVAELVFFFLISIFKRGWIASAVHSFVYMALSITELFKFGTNGNHLILSDMKLVRSVKSLSSFAYIKITPRLIIYCVLVIAVALLIFYLNPKFEFKKVRSRVAAIISCIVIGALMVMLPAFYAPVYKVFGVDTTPATNSFKLRNKFNNNSFLAFIVQTSSESFANRLKKPKDYDDDHVNSIIDNNIDTGEYFNGGDKPNVIVIMSESYADFRVFDELEIGDDVYEYFDKARSEGYAGTAITPTFASWTVRAEFELLFGLPVRGLNTPNMPQRELADREQPALAQYYKSWGYHTAYVHPFTQTFYSRSRIYGYFGFDDMMFYDKDTGETSFTVPIKTFGTYVDDSVVYDQLIDLIRTNDQPVYSHATTMQNHQPYDQGEDPDDEFGNYLTWIKHTNEGLDDFLNELKNIDEHTIVFFVGDHFPSLKAETSVYEQLGITGENCSPLYEQHYFIWSNYDADLSAVPDKQVSFFYMPFVLLNIIDAPRDAFIQTMNDYMEKLPVYSEEYDSEVPRDDELDMLTYDRVIGDVYSPSPIPEEVLTSEKEK
ncbi:MAG: sulfatase-like hydrolase/transferase [Ruminococcus sp.]|nr:sulfatase-like hydrolase/transferase [Ruminococcus sp.]